MKLRNTFLSILLAIFPLFLFSQQGGKYLNKVYKCDAGTLNYRIMFPYDFDENSNYPLVLFLHGMGERGNDNEKQLIHGSKLFQDSLKKYPAVYVFPQCDDDDYWASLYRPDQDGDSRRYHFELDGNPNKHLGMVMELINELLEKHWSDDHRFYVTGLSMGGMATIELGLRMNDKIAACLPICGAGPVAKASELTNIPFWFFHGLKDKVVNPNYSIELTKAIQREGGKAKISLFTDANHNSWDPAFADPEFLKWMFSQRLVVENGQQYKLKLSSKVEAIFQEMTIDEKIGQLNLLTPGGTVTGEVVSQGVEEKIKAGKVGGIFGIRGAEKVREVQKIAVEDSRLGIPLIFGLDVIHGHQTIFPIPLALSCSWDMGLIEKSARQAAREATADGLMWTFSPMVDIARDPRWGRIAEGAGEDPYLGSRIAEAMVKGYQQNDLRNPTTMLSCVKHFAAYGAAEGGRDYATVDMSKIRAHNEYLPPFKAAVNAGVASIMTAFNVYDYVPASANKQLFTDILRDLWGFEGFVVTDYTAIKEMIEHGSGDLGHVSAEALRAGIDMDMVSEGLVNTLKKSLKEGVIEEDLINRACRRILAAKDKLGLFDDPFRYFDEERSRKEIFSKSNRTFAREAAAETFVLLKNANEILPLKKKGKIALIGPLADSRRNMLGTWSVSGDHSKAVTLREGIEAAVQNRASILYAKGANISDDPVFANKVNAFGPEIVIDERTPDEMLKEALSIANQSDVIIVAVGEAADMSGEASSMAHIGLQDSQLRLLKELKKTEKPIIMLLYNGRPMTLLWENENMDAILDVWFGGTEGANAVADVIFGDVNPSGKLTSSFPVHVGQIPVYHSMLNTGRPVDGTGFKFLSRYLDIPNEALYPFGYGLSYSKFQYGDLKLTKDTLKHFSTMQVSIEVRNIGERGGKEIVQLYIRDKVASISRPVKELKAFQKIYLAPGESKTVTFEINRSMLGFYDEMLDYVIEAGEFEVMLGPNSIDLQKATFVLE